MAHSLGHLRTTVLLPRPTAQSRPSNVARSVEWHIVDRARWSSRFFRGAVIVMVRVRACSFFFICARGTLLLLLLLWLGRKTRKESGVAVRPPSGERFWQPLINCQNGRSGGCSHNNSRSSLKSCPIGLKICVLESHLNSEGDKNMIRTKIPIFIVSRIYLWYLACMSLELAGHV
jgi:hypothetical protein